MKQTAEVLTLVYGGAWASAFPRALRVSLVAETFGFQSSATANFSLKCSRGCLPPAQYYFTPLTTPLHPWQGQRKAGKEVFIGPNLWSCQGKRKRPVGRKELEKRMEAGQGRFLGMCL